MRLQTQMQKLSEVEGERPPLQQQPRHSDQSPDSLPLFPTFYHCLHRSQSRRLRCATIPVTRDLVQKEPTSLDTHQRHSSFQDRGAHSATLDYRPSPSQMALSRVPGDDNLYVGGYVASLRLSYFVCGACQFPRQLLLGAICVTFSFIFSIFTLAKPTTSISFANRSAGSLRCVGNLPLKTRVLLTLSRFSNMTSRISRIGRNTSTSA